MLIVTFLLFAWTTSCWFTQGMERSFLGLPFLSMDVILPFIVFALWSAVSGGIWIVLNGGEAAGQTRQWISKNRRTAVGITLIIFLYLALQIPAIVMYRAVNDSDTAHYGVAGYHIADGKERPMWFYGKHYNGNIPAHASALLHVLFGKHPSHLRLVNSLQYLGFLIFLFFIVRRLSDDRTALLAAALAAVPPYLINHYINLYFASVMFFGAWGFYLLVRLLEKETPAWRDYFWVGAVFGFGFYAHLQMIFFIFTALCVLFIRDKRVFLRLRFWTFAPGFLLGSIVTVIDSYYFDFIIFRRFFSQATEPRGLLSGFLDGAGEFFKHIPVLLGANGHLGLPAELLAFLVPITLLLVGIAVFALLVMNWRTLLNIFSLRDENAGMLIFVIFFFVLFLLFSASSESTPPSPPRYVTPIWFAVVPIIAAALIAVPKKRYLQAAAIALTLTFFAASHIAFDLHNAERERSLAGWEEFMRDRGIARYYGDFWITYLGNFFTREEIIGSCVPHFFEAYEPYYFAVADDPGPTIYHFRREDQQYRRIEEWLKNAGVSYDRVDAPYGIFFLNLSQRATVAQLFGLQKKPYRATIEEVHSSPIPGQDGMPLMVRMLSISIRNTGGAEWVQRKPGALVEFVILSEAGDVLRRHHILEHIDPGQTTTVRTILTEAELKADDLRAQVRVNDISLAEQALFKETMSEASEEPAISADRLTAMNFGDLQRDLFSDDFTFFDGWLNWEKPSGSLIRYAVDGRSRIGLALEKPETIELALTLAPYRYQGNMTPVQIDLSLNGNPLDDDVVVDRSRDVTIILPLRFTKRGLNTLEMTYTVVEPAYDRLETGGRILRYRRRAFSVSAMRITASGSDNSREGGKR